MVSLKNKAVVNGQEYICNMISHTFNNIFILLNKSLII